MTPKILSRKNYVHYGDFLERSDAYLRMIPRNSLVSKIEICNGRIQNRFFDHVIRTYGPKRSRRICLDTLSNDIDESRRLRRWFNKLRARGFSYRFVSGFDFGPDLRRGINLRFGLFFFDDLFYPPKVRRYMLRRVDPHIPITDAVCIGFALGRKLSSEWAILTLQSDLAFNKPSYVRDHIRGWQRILLSEVLSVARQAGTSRLLLTLASDQVMCCDPKFKADLNVPRSWQLIYDETAGFFDMSLSRIGRKLNVQVLESYESVATDKFYVKTLI